MIDPLRQDTTSPGERLFLDYCHAPGRYWSGSAARQARKLEKHLKRAARSRGASTTRTPRVLWDAARERDGIRRPTVYLANVGSSGSHWLEDMLVAGAGLLGAGEVYLPSSVRRAVDDLDRKEAGLFIDALHLLHASPAADDPTASIINSQHSPRQGTFLAADPTGVRVLLLRDPLEVVLSRSFRKGKYREDVAPAAADLDYLDANIATVTSFLTTAQTLAYDLVVRYEDLLVDPVPALEGICALTGAVADTERLRRVAVDHSAEQQVASGSTPGSNLYVGRRRPFPASAERRAARALAPLRAALGYDVGA